MGTRVRNAICAVSAMLVVVAASGGPAAAQGKAIRIGEINSYSGLATVYTFPYKEGLLMATKEINDAGGVLGRPIEFIFRDDKLKPDEAVKAARELVGQEKVDFLAGCISSGVGLAISAYAKEAKTLYFATHCQTSRLTWDDGHKYVAHTTNNVNQYVRTLAKKASTLPYKKWAHISPDYEYGHNVWDEFIAYLKQLKPDARGVVGIRECVHHRRGHQKGEEHGHRQGDRRARRRLRDGVPVGQGGDAWLRPAGDSAAVGRCREDERARKAGPGRHRGAPWP